MLWENICGRGCSELSCTAWTDGLGLRVEGGLCGVEGGCGAAAEAGHRQKRRRGFKKSRAWGLVGGVVLCFFLFPFPSPQRRLVFSARMLRSVDADAMSADRVQGARLVFSSACIVCIIYSHCLAKAPAN